MNYYSVDSNITAQHITNMVFGLPGFLSCES